MRNSEYKGENGYLEMSTWEYQWWFPEMCERGILSQHVMRSIDIRLAKDLLEKEKNMFCQKGTVLWEEIIKMQMVLDVDTLYILMKYKKTYIIYII